MTGYLWTCSVPSSYLFNSIVLGSRTLEISDHSLQARRGRPFPSSLLLFTNCLRGLPPQIPAHPRMNVLAIPCAGGDILRTFGWFQLQLGDPSPLVPARVPQPSSLCIPVPFPFSVAVCSTLFSFCLCPLPMVWKLQESRLCIIYLQGN